MITDLIVYYAELLNEIDISDSLGKQQRDGLVNYLGKMNEKALETALTNYQCRIQNKGYKLQPDDIWIMHIDMYKRKGTIRATPEELEAIRETTEERRIQVRKEIREEYPYLFKSVRVT